MADYAELLDRIQALEEENKKLKTAIINIACLAYAGYNDIRLTKNNETVQAVNKIVRYEKI